MRAHCSDQELLGFADRELTAAESTAVEKHLAACWSCRTRMRDLEAAIGDVVRLQESIELPPAGGPRAMLRARLAELVEVPQRRHWFTFPSPAYAALVVVALLVIGALLIPWRSTTVFAMPKPSLTPGATIPLSREQVCAARGEDNRAVPEELQRRVFEAYGIPRANPAGYEVDYLITPALGGADDIRNLWPQPYSAVWNAHVKDALEDRLRSMVCDGRIELAEAQSEIAGDWIAASKKHFRTEQPLDSN